MAGEYLLVAPMFKGQKERTVVLPKETGTISIQVNMWAMAEDYCYTGLGPYSVYVGMGLFCHLWRLAYMHRKQERR